MEEAPRDQMTEEQLGEPAHQDEYAIIEIFGHRRHAGRIMEVERFGAKMLRVDVPNDGDFANGYVSHFYGGSSIFSLTGTDLESVKRANTPWRPAGNKALPAPESDEPDGDTRDTDDELEMPF